MNYLAQAMMKRKQGAMTEAPKKKPMQAMPLDPDRHLEMHESEIGKGKFYPGNKISVKAHGIVSSMHDDGRMMMKVHKVEMGDMPEMDEAETNGKPKKAVAKNAPIVRLQTEPAA